MGHDSLANRLTPLAPMEARLADIAETWFPESFASGRFDPNRLYEIAAGEASSKQPFFGQLWPGKADAARLLTVPSNGALIRDPSLSREERAQDANVFCIGDNLEIMKLLQPAYFGRFKMAFVDPPYNTVGDFIYTDDVEDPTGAYLKLCEDPKSFAINGSGNTHGAWLSMMLPRLFVMRNLLRDDGVAFVVIDDHESHHLRMLMDEVFGEENFVCTFVWEKRYAPAPDAPNVGYVHETVLCYRKSDAFTAALLPMTEAQRGRYRNLDDDPRGPWKPADYTCRYTAVERPSLYYPIDNPNTGEKVWPKKTRVWACSPETHAQNVKDKLIWWPRDAEVPAKKKFLDKIAQGAKPRSLLEREVVGHTDEATKELRDVLPEIKLTPKPTRLVAHLMKVAGIEDGDLVLDPFGGVGTVGAATLQVPQGEPVPRFVSIELPEPVRDGMTTLAEAGISRITRLAQAKGRNANLRVVRLVRTGIKNWFVRSTATLEELDRSLELAIDPIDRGRSGEQILAEIALQAGVPFAEIPSDMGEGHCYEFRSADVTIVLEGALTEEGIKVIETSSTTRIVFLDSAFDADESLRIRATRMASQHGKVLRFV